MQLELRFAPDGTLWRVWKTIPAISAAFDRTGTLVALDADDPRVETVLTTARSAGSMHTRLLWSFTPDELRSASVVRVLLRGPLVQETKADDRRQLAALSATPHGESPDAIFGSRWLSEIQLQNWKDRPGKLCGLKSIAGHWLLDRAHALAFAQGLEGVALGVVRDRDGAPRPDVVLLGAAARAVPCSRRFTFGEWADPGVNPVSPLVYDDITAFAGSDIWRGAEGFTYGEVGELLLSARAFAQWQQAGIRGAAFEPVWDGRSAPGAELVRCIEAVMARLEGVPGSDGIAPLQAFANMV